MKKNIFLMLILVSSLTFSNTADLVQTNLNWTWTLIGGILVFFMQAGFAMVETGFTRAKNSGNIIMKNTMDFCIGILTFWAIGFAFMFGTGSSFIGGGNFFGGGLSEWNWTFFIFQGMFSATAATIVSGAIAERAKFSTYLIITFFISAFIYPVYGHWAWAGLFGQSRGWLENLGFIDFAGSAVVHSVGGWVALAGAMILGPRIGKYTDKTPNAIPGHSLTLGALGVFILWFAWYGFNCGSTTTGTYEIGLIAVNTALAPAAAALSALAVSYKLYKTFDIGLVLNGILAGLVGVTAGCASIKPWAAVIIGLTSGVIVIYSIRILDRLKIDDPVGAVSVHGVCGAWGTICAGIFFSESLFNIRIIGIQVLGAAAAFIFAFIMGSFIFTVLKHTLGIRVSILEEIKGLDLSEHEARSYPEFQERI
jgi:Amt family ammonium transporter